MNQPLSAALVLSRPSHVPFIVGYGGGVDSTAMLIGLQKRGIRPDLITFADTGNEKPETYRFLPILDAWLRANGMPGLTRIKKISSKTGDTTLEENCLRLQTLPSRAYGMSSCAMKWKIEPQEKFLNAWQPAIDCWAKGAYQVKAGLTPGGKDSFKTLYRSDCKPIKALGYDGGEERRAKHTEDDKLRYWYPLIEWGWERENCKAIILEAIGGLPPKSACFFCPSSTKEEVLWLNENHPDLMKRALKMEAHALANTEHPLLNVKGLGRHWSWKELLEADTAKRACMSNSPVEACTICTEPE